MWDTSDMYFDTERTNGNPAHNSRYSSKSTPIKSFLVTEGHGDTDLLYSLSLCTFMSPARVYITLHTVLPAQ